MHTNLYNVRRMVVGFWTWFDGMLAFEVLEFVDIRIYSSNNKARGWSLTIRGPFFSVMSACSHFGLVGPFIILTNFSQSSTVL